MAMPVASSPAGCRVISANGCSGSLNLAVVLEKHAKPHRIAHRVALCDLADAGHDPGGRGDHLTRQASDVGSGATNLVPWQLPPAEIAP
jgi:hypothetical protein